MHKTINVTLCANFSPTCQVLIYEVIGALPEQAKSEFLANCDELLVISLEGSVIAFCPFNINNGWNASIESLYLRNVIKNKELTRYWLSRQLKHHLITNPYP